MAGKKTKSPAEKAQRAAATRRNKLKRIRRELNGNPRNISAKRAEAKLLSK